MKKKLKHYTLNHEYFSFLDSRYFISSEIVIHYRWRPSEFRADFPEGNGHLSPIKLAEVKQVTVNKTRPYRSAT